MTHTPADTIAITHGDKSVAFPVGLWQNFSNGAAKAGFFSNIELHRPLHAGVAEHRMIILYT
ncbi:MAG: hypothetical protein ACKVKL_14215 [Pseudomonadales bacterium]